MIGKPPRYSVPACEFPFRALAALAGRAPVGAGREIVLATLVTARLTIAALGQSRLPLKSREVRAGGARNWLLSLALQQPVLARFQRLAEATGTDDIEFMGRAFAEVLDVADPHLDHPSRLELGRVVHRMSVEQSGEVLERVISPT